MISTPSVGQIRYNERAQLSGKQDGNLSLIRWMEMKKKNDY